MRWCVLQEPKVDSLAYDKKYFGIYCLFMHAYTNRESKSEACSLVIKLMLCRFMNELK